MEIKAVSTADVSDAEKLWTDTVDASPDAWAWHTWTALQFNLVAGQKFEARDDSFFIYADGKPVGVVILVYQKKTVGDFEGLEASYYSGFLPWPCFVDGVEGEELNALEDFAFQELERRARAAGAGHIRVRRVPPTDPDDEGEHIERIARTHKYIHRSFSVGVVGITPETLTKDVRERYRRYYHKFAPEFDLFIAEGEGMTLELEEAYFALHVKDAGGQFRSRESYTKQADIARRGEGWYVVARDKASGTIAGMLLVSLYKNVAMDNSVAIDPDFTLKRVGLLVRVRAIEELVKRGVMQYELGQKRYNIPSLERVPSQKDIGIAEFKDGFTRGHSRVRYELEKFLDPQYLHAYLAERESTLKEFFEL